MKAMRNRRSCGIVAMAGVLLAGAFGAGPVRGDDFVTLSGTTYHDVRPVRVEPDGVTWEYSEGVCKVDFADSPKSVCQAYRYDPAKAVAYHDAQMKERQDADVRKQQILKENDERHLARMQAASAAMASRVSPSSGTDLIFRRATSPAASEATRALGEQLEAAAAKRAVEPTGIWGDLARSRTGAILAGVGLVNFTPLDPIANKDNARVSSQTTLGSSHSASAAGQPAEYETRRYYDDVDRAEAFARGVPLKP